MDLPLVVAPEITAALAEGRAVVALESTLVAHGLPWPDNLEVGRELEAAVRRRGALPATIAVVKGTLRVGLDDEALEDLARRGSEYRKAGAADLAVALASGGDAATTVSATSAIAARAGIAVFATGGIGGVHRGPDGDVSHDLAMMARSQVAVVSAGAKSILDLPRTLEMLETLGVLVVGYRTDELPAFYTRTSGLRLDHRVDDATAMAKILMTRFDALGQGGVLIANPIPVELALDPVQVDAVIADALASAAGAGIRGKALTPYLLARIAEVTGGAAVKANRGLAIHNAEVGAEVAVALAAVRRGGKQSAGFRL